MALFQKKEKKQEVKEPIVKLSTVTLKCDNQLIRKYISKGCWIKEKDENNNVIIEGREEIMKTLE
jgi:type II secretory pathway component GspD/PulD (secretin)